MKFINMALAIVVVAVSTALAVYFADSNKQAVRTVTISILKQIPRSCLVLETAEELTVANIDDGGMLFGPRTGMATAVRRSQWGLQLSEVTPQDVVVSGREVRVKLPNPVVFDTVVDMSSFRFLTRRSCLQALVEVVFRRSLMKELAEIACRTPPKYSAEQVQSRRTEFVRRLNEQAATLFAAKDLVVRFE